MLDHCNPVLVLKYYQTYSNETWSTQLLQEAAPVTSSWTFGTNRCWCPQPSRRASATRTARATGPHSQGSSSLRLEGDGASALPPAFGMNMINFTCTGYSILVIESRITNSLAVAFIKKLKKWREAPPIFCIFH